MEITNNSQLIRFSTLVLLLTSLQVSAESAKSWLKQMSNAVQTQSYSGTFVYIHNDQIEAMQIEQRNSTAGISERLYSLNGEAREVIKNNSEVTCIWSDTKSVVVDQLQRRSGFPARLPENLDQLEKHYDITISGEERIADRQCKVIDISPKDNFRYGYRIWVDKKSHLVLKSTVLDMEDHPVEQIMFTKLEVIENVPDEELKPFLEHKDYKYFKSKNDEKAFDVTNPSWMAKRLPPGFRLTSYTKKEKPQTFGVDHLVFSDGMASVSVFIEAVNENQKRLDGSSHMGGVNAFGLERNNHHVTVVGEVPSATVELIGQSIQPK